MPGSILGEGTDYYDRVFVFSSPTPGKLENNILNWVTTVSLPPFLRIIRYSQNIWRYVT
jgi:hypothetical protein